VRYVHQIRGFVSPTDDILVKATIHSIRRELGTAPSQKAALTAKMIGAMLDTCDSTLLGCRDRALIALGFAAALRRSELVAVQAADRTETERRGPPWQFRMATSCCLSRPSRTG
jgi:integrase